MRTFGAWVVTALLAAPLAARPADERRGAAARAVLPPELPWTGKSESLVVAPGHAWITPAEASGFARTPRYDETVAWLQRLAAMAPEVQLVSLGRSAEGRDVWMVVASRDRARTPQALHANGKPTLLVQGSIHAGEMDGKDAGMMLLRDMTGAGGKRALLDGANLLFVPIFNVDGHERFSDFTRINQRGPSAAGWRTNSRNLNLNRDFAKADTPEVHAMLRALGDWAPDLYLDVHVTDGADYQYDITFGHNGARGWSPSIGQWLDRVWTPAITEGLAAMGHVPGPLVFPVDDKDLTKGIVGGMAPPRFSQGYADARHLPAVLQENHSLKPYKQRVLGTYVLIESALRLLQKESASLRAAVAADRQRRAEQVTLDWKMREGTPESLEFAAVESRIEPSAVSGGTRVVWTGRPKALRVPVLMNDAPAAAVSRPRAYLIPPAWEDVVQRLEVHGIKVERLDAAREVEVEMYRLKDAKLDGTPFEGHVRVTARPVVERRRQRFAAGTARVNTDQPLGDLAVLLLEPASPDSFFQWGFFHEVLQPTEYVEGYVMEPMGEAMLAEDAALKAEYEAAVRADAKLAADPRARLQWLYARTPFFDERRALYPVAREQ